MTSIIRAAIQNRQVVYVLTAAAVIVGLHALVAMPRREDPKITIRQGLVLAMYPGATAEQVEAQVTRKVEPLLFGYAEVKKQKTYTTSRSGGLVANVELEDWVTDPDRFWAMLRHDLNELRARELPAELLGPIVDSNFGDVVAVLLTVRGERYGSRELTEYLDRIDDALRAIPAVSKIRRYGEQPEEIAVTVRPGRLAEVGLTMQQIAAALGQRNEVRDGGSVAAGTSDAAIRLQGLLRSEDELRELIVGAARTGQVVHLSDVATVGRRYADPDYVVRVDGTGAVLMSVEMQAGNNIVAFGKTIHAKIADVRTLLPNDLAVDLVADQPAMVQHRVFDFGREFGIAVLAVILVTGVLLPLRVAAMAAVAIPITVAVTIAVLDMLGIELHQISFAGLVVALGMVVDDAIVVADNYVEKLDHGLSPFEAAWRGTGELANPVLGATLTIVASFLPLAILMPGYVGEFIRTMPVTVSVALLSSYLVAMFLTPLLSMAMIKTGLQRGADTKRRRTPLDIMQEGYEWLMRRAMPRKRLTLAIAGGAFAAGLVMMRVVPQRFFPTAERDQFVVDVWMPEGTRIEATDSVVTRIADVVRRASDVRMVATFTGAGSPRFYYNVNPEAPASNYGQLLVNTASAEATTALVASLREPLAAVAPEARVYVKELQQGPPLQAPIEVRISGADLRVLRTLADSVTRLVVATAGREYVSTDWNEDAYGLALTLRREVASRLGITEATIAGQLAAGFDGAPVSTFWEGGRRIGVRLRYDEPQRRSLTDVANAYVTSPMTGARVPVRQVADVRADWQASRIVRRNGVRTLTVRSFAKNGVLASSVLAAVKPAVARLSLPDGYAISYGGEAENQAEVEAPMAVALGVSLVGIFGILFFQFRSIRHPLIVMVSIPLALVGSALGLIVTRNPFGFTANLGLTALTGVVVRNAIILVEYIIERRRHGVDLDVAALEAGRRRLRPIFLTTMAAAAGVVPMILSGSTLWSPLASVLAVGLVCSMVFTLVVVPVLFVMVERRIERRGGESSRVTPLAKPHLTHSPATLEPAAMGAATALVVGALLALAVPTSTKAQSPTVQPQNGAVLTLGEAIGMATSNSRLSNMARAKVSEKAAAARGARAELFPRVSLDATVVTSNMSTSIEVPRGSLGTYGASLVFAGLMVSQPLTPLLRIAEGSRVARAALRESEAEYATTDLDLALAAEKLYFGVLMAEDRRDAAQAMVVARRAVCVDAERAVSAGMSVAARVSEARASALEAEQVLMTSSHAAEDARAALNALLGLPLDAAPALAVPPAAPSVDDLASQVTLAGRQRPEIAAASAKVDQARHAVGAARTEYIPDVAVFVRQSYQDAVAYVPTNSFSAGVQARWNVLDFGRRSAQVDQRSATLRLAEESLAHMRDQVALEVEKAYRNAIRADQLVMAARQALLARQDVERLTAGQTAAGVVVPAVAQEAVARRMAAESSLLEAELGAHLAHAELARAVGEKIAARNSQVWSRNEP